MFSPSSPINRLAQGTLFRKFLKESHFKLLSTGIVPPKSIFSSNRSSSARRYLNESSEALPTLRIPHLPLACRIFWGWRLP